MIVDWQFEPIKGTLLHVDLQRIAMDKKLTVTVPVVLKGEAAGVKTEGGILEQLLREIEIECLPADIPKNIEVDISHLVFGVEVRVKDLPHSEKLKFLTEENQMIAHITTVKEEVVATPEAWRRMRQRLRLSPKSSRRVSRKLRVKARPRAMPRARPSRRRLRSPRRKRRNSCWRLRVVRCSLRDADGCES